jgi:hypothetical protein
MTTIFDTANPHTIERCSHVIRPHIRRTPLVALNLTDFGG